MQCVLSRMEESLLKNECYICMEPCQNKSPCVCATHVHPRCLKAYLETSRHTHCTICLGAYPLPVRRKRCCCPSAVHRAVVFACLLVFAYAVSFLIWTIVSR